MIDYSTINREALESLEKIGQLSPNYRLQDWPGNGCAGDPPGYPTYFTRSIYTRGGNTPSSGPEQVISVPWTSTLYVTEHSKDWRKGFTWDDVHAQYEERMRRLWKPLPLDHERTRQWILSLYQHFNHCYQDVEYSEYGRPGTLIYPVPHHKLDYFSDDERWNDAYRNAKRAEVEVRNAMVRERASRIAIPENHLAVIRIRKFYPEYEPELDLIENPPKLNVPTWWEVEDVAPTPETCRPRHGWRHPVNNTWCQHCGWREESK